MARHHLVEAAPRRGLAEVVEQVGGVHAQVMSGAELALAARVADVTPAAVQAALWDTHTLVKTWAMRGTLHLFAARDYWRWVAAFRTRRRFEKAIWLRHAGGTLAEIQAITEAVYAALEGQCLTRDELATAVGTHTGRPELAEKLRSGWGEFLKPAAYQGYLCFGPSRGQSVTFVRPDQWLGRRETVDSTEALHAVMRRYWTTYGPATRDDFAAWWGTDPGEIRPAFDALRGELAEVRVDDWKALALKTDVDQIAAGAPVRVVRLLGLFDPYTTAAYRDRRHLIPDALKDRIYRTAGWISAVVLVDGRIAGVWEQTKRKGGADIAVELFEPLDDTLQAGIAAEAARLGRVWGQPTAVIYKET
jgi:hypothetical protein